MNVILTCTPEYSPIKLAEIVKLLQSIPGELNFIEGKPLTQAQFKRANEKFENPTQEYSDRKNCRAIRPEGYTCVSRQISYRSVY